MTTIVSPNKVNHRQVDGILRMLAARDIHVSAALSMLVYLSHGIRTDDPCVPEAVNGLACELQRFVMGRATRPFILSLACQAGPHMDEVLQPDVTVTRSIDWAWTALREFIRDLNTVAGNNDWKLPVLSLGSFMAAGVPDTISVALRIPAVYVDIQASICAAKD